MNIVNANWDVSRRASASPEPIDLQTTFPKRSFAPEGREAMRMAPATSASQSDGQHLMRQGATG
ncbi:hypothetical protein JF542_19840 [Salipiger bermudensis]|nr:hypothetical protein [Salipiger bermudensis]